MIANDIKFTIAIPAFKGRFLKECITSILKQTYENYEIIIVNDASPDDLDSIVYGFTDARIQYYTNEIGCGEYNVVDNWNKCLEYASGHYIICMGDDDKLLPNCLSDYISLIHKYPDLDLYHMRTEIIDGNSNVIDLQEACPERESVYSMIWHRWNGRKQYIGDFLFKTSTLKKNGGFYVLPTGCCSDEISAYIAAEKNGVANAIHPGFQYRNNSLTLSNSTHNLRSKLEAFLWAKEWYTSFLRKKEPIDYLDKTYHAFLLKKLDGYISSFSDFCIRTDIKYKSFRDSLYWFKNRKKYNISVKYIIYHLLKSLL